MRLIGILVLLIGIALAGGALVYANKLFSKYGAEQQQAQAEKIETVPVIVAAVKIDFGQQIEEDLVRIVDWPAEFVPEKAFTSPEDLFGDKSEEARVATRAMDPGDPILETKVSGFGADASITRLLGEGKRAFSLQIDAVSGVAGFVSPGDRVDIILTESQNGQISSRVILQDIQVIAVDQQSQKRQIGAQIGRTATLAVTPRQVQMLALAQQIGKLSLTLRGANDVYTEGESEELGPVDVNDLLQIEQAEEKKPSGTRVRVRKGTETTDVVVGD